MCRLLFSLCFILFTPLIAQSNFVYQKVVEDRVCYRVYSRDTGFVIVAGETPDGRLLAKVDQGTFSLDSLPDGFVWWLDQCAETIALAESSQTQQKVTLSSIPPLIKTKWGQEYPFNCAIPYATDRYLTGCVATAMGQIMCYYQWPNKGNGRMSQKVDGLDFLADFTASPYQYDLMKTQYVPGQYTEAEAQAMSKLLYHAGMSINMNYGTQGSGALVSTVTRSLSTYFGYDKGMTFETRKYYSDAEWQALMYNELSAGRPIIYRGTNVSDESRQHCFICDGYDAETNLFHFNWGWEGVADGYFAIFGQSALDGPTFNYGNSQSMVIGIQPADSESKAITRLSVSNLQMKVKPSGSKSSQPYSLYVIADDVTSLPAVTLSASCRNSGLLAKSLQVGIRLTQTATGQSRVIPCNSTLSPTYSVLTTVNATFDPSSMTNASGVYSLELVFRPKTSGTDDDWVPAHLAPDTELPLLQFGGKEESQTAQSKNDDVKVENKLTIVATQSCEVSREAGLGNLVSTVSFDEAAVCRSLGVGSVISDLLFPVKRTTGEALSEGHEYAGWFDVKGDPIAYSKTNNAVINVAAPKDGMLRIHTNPEAELQPGDVCQVSWAFVNGNKMVQLDVKINVIEPKKPAETIGQDYTRYIVNPDFTGNDLSGWQGEPWTQFAGVENAEHFEAAYYDTYQVISGLPKGMYLIEVDGLDRRGAWEEVIKDNRSNLRSTKAVLYASSSEDYYQCAMRQLLEGASTTPLSVAPARELFVTLPDGHQCYIPDDMASAADYFRNGRYRNGIYAKVGDDGELTIGIHTRNFRSASYRSGLRDWLCVDNWHLTYLGENYTEHYPGETLYSTRSSDIVNPNFDDCDYYSGWLGTQYKNDLGEDKIGTLESWEIAGNSFQYLSGLTPGKYLLEVDAYDFHNGVGIYSEFHRRQLLSNFLLYARSSVADCEVPILRWEYGWRHTPLYDESLWEAQDWVPEAWCYQPTPDMTERLVSEENCYHNGLIAEVGDDGELQIGIKAIKPKDSFYAKVDNWRLTYLGKTDDAPTGADAFGFRKQFSTYERYLSVQERIDDFQSGTSSVDKIDLTSVFCFPHFDKSDGIDTGDDMGSMYFLWNFPPDIQEHCAEGWRTSLDVHQDFSPLPEGYYELRCQGFYRYNDCYDNTNAVAVRTHADGSERLLAYLYANSDSVPLQSIVTDVSTLRNDPSISSIYNNEFESGLPFSMHHSRLAFDAGLYDDNVVYFYLNGYEPLTIGIRKTEIPGADWTIFDNFRLYYCGKNKPEDFEVGIQPLSHGPEAYPHGIYDLYGRKMNSLQKGLHVVDGRIINY